MNLTHSATVAELRSVPRLIMLAALMVSGPVAGETVTTVNGTNIDSSVFDFYIESRTQMPPEQATAEQRDALLGELRDIYLLATQDTAAGVRADSRVQAQIELQTRSLIAQGVAGEFVDSMEISDADVEAEYARQAEMAPPLQFKARHILVESQGEAMAIIGELDSGADFETLARERSTGPSGPTGGDLGWFAPDQMVAPFSAAVQAMEDGAYTSDPVQTQFGWHVILREGSRESEAPPLESVRETIVQAIQQQRFQAWLEELRSSSVD